MRTVDEVWRAAYEGEVLGEALFARLAALLPPGPHRDRVEVLRRLEGATRDLLQPVLVRRGIDPTGTSAARDAGSGYAEGLAARPWAELVSGLQTATASYAALYAELQPLVEPEDRPVVEALVAHEEALRAFASLEAAGDPGSVAPILALPHVAAWSPA